MTESFEPPARGLYDRIEQIRKARGWTKVQLSRTVGVHRTTIDNLRKQPKTPHVPTVVEIADALDIPRDEALRLAGLTGSAIPDQPATPKPALEAQDELLARLERIRADPHRRELLDRYLDLLDSAG